MFNHSTQEQNITWVRDPNRLCITYRAWRDIHAGEELCECDDEITLNPKLSMIGISYGSHLTFKDADNPPPAPPDEELEQLWMIEPY